MCRARLWRTVMKWSRLWRKGTAPLTARMSSPFAENKAALQQPFHHHRIHRAAPAGDLHCAVVAWTPAAGDEAGGTVKSEAGIIGRGHFEDQLPCAAGGEADCRLFDQRPAKPATAAFRVHSQGEDFRIIGGKTRKDESGRRVP